MMYSSSSRRGQLQISFHWIFALIGGVMFLLFFFILIRSILTSSEEQDIRELSFATETIIKTALSNPDTFSVAELPDAAYTFACRRDSQGFSAAYVRINDQSFEQLGLRHLPLFSPSRINGDELFLSSHSWSAPFPIGNLVAVSNNRTRYVFVAGVADVVRIRNFLKEQNLGSFGIDVRSIDTITSYSDEGYDQYRFIFLNTGYNPSLLKQELRPGNTAVAITSTDMEAGMLAFYDDLTQSSPTGQLSFFGEAMLTGAFFSQSWQQFDCNMEKARERLQGAIRILQLRMGTLYPNTDASCQQLYDQATGYLSSYAADPDAAFDAESNPLGGPISRLADLNSRLLSRNCPLLY